MLRKTVTPEPGTVAHTCNPSTKQPRQERFEFKALPEPHSETLSQNKKGEEGEGKEGGKGKNKRERRGKGREIGKVEEGTRKPQ